MKKLLLTLMFGITLLAVTNSNAQSNADSNKKEIKFGLKAGVNVATIRGENLNVNPKLGAHFGIITELKLYDNFSIQPELLYSQIGARGSDSSDLFDSSDNSTLFLDYFTVPVMAKYYLLNGFNITAGPQFSFLVNDTFSLDVFDSVSQTVTPIDLQIENFDLGFNLGMGYQFENGFFFETRYAMGITPIQENPDVRNAVFQMSLGYQF